METSIPVQNDAVKLAKHTIKITLNARKFPKKYRHNLIDELIKTTIRLSNAICDANTHSGAERLKHIDTAIAECRNVKIGIDIVYDTIHPDCSIGYWNGMAEDIEKQLRNWKIGTRKRMK